MRGDISYILNPTAYTSRFGNHINSLMCARIDDNVVFDGRRLLNPILWTNTVLVEVRDKIKVLISNGRIDRS